MPQIYIIMGRPVAGSDQPATTLCFYEFQSYMDTYIVADDEAACFCYTRPGKTELFTVDLAADGDTGPGVAIWILDHAAKFRIELDRFCNSADSEIAIYLIGTVIIHIFVFR